MVFELLPRDDDRKCPKHPPWARHCTSGVIRTTLYPFCFRVCRIPTSVAQTVDFRCPQRQKSKGTQINGRSTPCCRSTTSYPLFRKHVVQEFPACKKKCGEAPSYMNHTWILVCRLTHSNSSGSVGGTLGQQPIQPGWKEVGFRKPVACNVFMDTQREHCL
jgi:hypothetical protein